MEFVELKAFCTPDYSEILIAELAEIGFDSFVEHSEGFDAYAESGAYDEALLQGLKYRYEVSAGFSYEINQVAKINWNEEWEKNYDPIFIDDRAVVKASFHNLERVYPIEIVVNPKMSFGTGHHETTFQMLSQQLDIDHKGKHVLDAGCGTGVLAIMASKLGAASVEACDIDEWSVENSSENFRLNQVENVHVALGKTSEMKYQEPFDIVLANINRNVLLEEMELYGSLLKDGAYLVLSGFYAADITDIEAEAKKYQIYKIKQTQKNQWVSVLLERKFS